MYSIYPPRFKIAGWLAGWLAGGLERLKKLSHQRIFQRHMEDTHIMIDSKFCKKEWPTRTMTDADDSQPSLPRLRSLPSLSSVGRASVTNLFIYILD